MARRSRRRQVAISSRMKAFWSFSDTLSSTIKSGWKAVRSGWTVSSNTVVASTTDYPISTVQMAVANTTSSVLTGSGNKLISTSGTVGSIGSGNGTTGQSGFHWATITGMSSTAGLSVGDWISATAGTGTLYGGTPDFVEITSIIDTTSITYRIKGGTVPIAGTVTNIVSRGQDGGSGISVWVTDSGNWWGISYGRSRDTSCNCSVCGNGTYSCTGYGTSGGCTSYGRYCSSPSCSGWSAYSQANYGQATTGYYRIFSYTKTYDCSRYSQSCNSSCLSSSYSTFCSSSVQNTSSCNCQTCYPPYISLIKSISSVVSEAARWSLASMAGAIKVITNSSTKAITIRPYRDTSMTSQIGSDLTHTATGAIISNKFGIILTPSDYVQGSTVSDFNINTN